MPSFLPASALVRRSTALWVVLGVALGTTATLAQVPREGDLDNRPLQFDRHPAVLASVSTAGQGAGPALPGPAVPPAAAQLALGHVQAGFRLGRRGAFYSARSEFVSALRLLAQARDLGSPERPHTAALGRALRALRESDDFVPRGLDLETQLDLDAIVAVHRTTILKDQPPHAWTAVDALRRYYTYAQQQLAMATGHDPVGAMALYGLARVEMALGRQQPQRHPAAGPRAMVLHQASLLADPENYAAANELGVLLARHGRLVEAQQILQHSIDIAPTRAAWHNLSVLYRQLGQPDLAVAAEARARALVASPAGKGPTVAGDGRSPVEWLDAVQFARTRPADVRTLRSGRPAPVPPPGPVSAQRRATGEGSGQKGWFGWLPWTRSARAAVAPAAERQ